MTTPRQPTNQDLLKEIREVKSMQRTQGGDIQTLKDWKQSLDIGQAAVSEYKRQEQQTSEARKRRELLKQAGIIFGLIITVLYVYIESHGVHP